MEKTATGNLRVFYADVIARNPEFGDVLEDYTQVTEIKRDVRRVFDVDDPEEIKKLIGTNVRGFEVTDETYRHAVLVEQEHERLYQRCKELMRELS